MNKHKQLITIFDECLNRLLDGETVSACLEGYEAQRTEIRPLLMTVAVARRADAVVPRSPQAIAEAKADFLAAAAARRLEAKGTARRRRIPRPRWPGIPRALPRFLPAWATMVIATLLVVLLLAGSAVVTSAHTLPGDLLYPVKLAAEQMQVSLTLDPEIKKARQEAFDMRRLREANEVIKRGRVIPWGYLSGVIESMGKESWVIGCQATRVSIRIDERTEIEGEPVLEARAGVKYSVPRPGELVARRIRILAVPIPTPRPLPEVMPSPTISPTPTQPLVPAPVPTKLPPRETPELPETRVPRPSVAPPPTETPTATSTPTATASPSPTPTATPSPTDTPTPEPPTPRPPRPVEVRITGLIESMTAQRWVVAGRPILLTVETSIDETAGRATVGAEVVVHAIPGKGGALVARRIVVQKSAQPKRVEFTGLIEEIGAHSWKVGGQWVEIGPKTGIPEVVEVGWLAHVEALRYPDGRLMATRIVVERPGMEERFLEGAIESMGEDTWMVAGTVIVLDGQTVIEGRPEVGKRAEIQGYLQADGSVLARHIRVLEPTATPTPTPSPTLSPTPTTAGEETPTRTPTAAAAGITPTATPSPSPMPTATSEKVFTTTPTATPMAGPTPTVTPEGTPSETPTAVTPSPTPTTTVQEMPTGTPTAEAAAVTPTATALPGLTSTPTPEETPLR